MITEDLKTLTQKDIAHTLSSEQVINRVPQKTSVHLLDSCVKSSDAKKAEIFSTYQNILRVYLQKI